MNVFIPRESNDQEERISMVPASVERLVKLGATVLVQEGLGTRLGIPDSDYQKAGATITTEANHGFQNADLVFRLNKPPVEEIKRLKSGCILVSYLNPFFEKAVIDGLASANVSAIAMEMIPRTTIAQKMDALSSQANLAGYVAVIIAAERMKKILPMMMTPSGTIQPSRVFVIGVGVAGLQAIATAKRLGARVEAFDTRPAVEEQVKSLGAKFVKIDLGQTGEAAGGYAKALTEEQVQKQREGMKKHCAQADIVITTAQLFGKKAPLIVTEEMVNAMSPGSVIVDLAVESGGNVAGAKLDQEVDVKGVKIIGLRNLPGRVAVHASQMYSANLYNFFEHFWDKETKKFKFDPNDEILKACLVTHNKEICNPQLKGI